MIHLSSRILPFFFLFKVAVSLKSLNNDRLNEYEEKIAVGSIKIKDYFKILNIGFCLIPFFVIFIFIISQGVYVATDYYLSYW